MSMTQASAAYFERVAGDWDALRTSYFSEAVLEAGAEDFEGVTRAEFERRRALGEFVLWWGIGLIALPRMELGVEGPPTGTRFAVANLVSRPGFTMYVVALVDQNGLIGYGCDSLQEGQVDVVDDRGVEVLVGVLPALFPAVQVGLQAGHPLGLGGAERRAAVQQGHGERDQADAKPRFHFSVHSLNAIQPELRDEPTLPNLHHCHLHVPAFRIAVHEVEGYARRIRGNQAGQDIGEGARIRVEVRIPEGRGLDVVI